MWLFSILVWNNSYDLFCPIFEKERFIEHLCIVLSYEIAFFFNLVCFDLV